MRRGDLVAVATQGDFGKPRPALVIQTDQFEATATVTALLVSSTLIDAPLLRLGVQPTPGNGLRKPSQIMVDEVTTVRRDKVSEPFGRLETETILAVTRSLALFLSVG